jgi:hypothetical protein
MTANTPASRKNKGRLLQQKVRDDLIAAIDLSPHDIQSRGMGQPGADLHLSQVARDNCPFSIECKSQEALNIWQAMKQCEANTEEGLMPLLIFKRNRSEIYACLRWDDLLLILEGVRLALRKRRR